MRLLGSIPAGLLSRLMAGTWEQPGWSALPGREHGPWSTRPLSVCLLARRTSKSEGQQGPMVVQRRGWHELVVGKVEEERIWGCILQAGRIWFGLRLRNS